MTTTPPEPTTTEGKDGEDPTDYGGYDGDGARRRRRRRRATFGAQPPSTAVDSTLLVVTNGQGAGQLFAFVDGVPAELSVNNSASYLHIPPFNVQCNEIVRST